MTEQKEDCGQFPTNNYWYDNLDKMHPDYRDRYIKKIRDAKAKAGIVGTSDDDLNFGA
jgi:hypothetical protein